MSDILTVPKLVQDMLAEAEQWRVLKTRFGHGCCEKGKQVDCIRYLVRIGKDFGVVPEGYRPPHVPGDWYRFPDLPEVPEGQRKYDPLTFRKEVLKFANLIPSWNDRRPGDIVGFQYGKYHVECHEGLISYKDKFYHSSPRFGVKRHSLSGFSSNICALYRLKVLMDV